MAICINLTRDQSEGPEFKTSNMLVPHLLINVQFATIKQAYFPTTLDSTT